MNVRFPEQMYKLYGWAFVVISQLYESETYPLMFQYAWLSL